jgi:ABC-type uncharacterized transport system substrate-binding protein
MIASSPWSRLIAASGIKVLQAVVILALPRPVSLLKKQQRIPIVFLFGIDPAKVGFATSRAPGGNFTGIESP